MKNGPGNTNPFDGIDMFVETDIVPSLLLHEQERAQTARRIIMMLGSLAVLAIAFIIFGRLEFGGFDAYLPHVFIGGIFGGGFIFASMTKGLRHKAKIILAGGLARYIGWNFIPKGFRPLSVALFRDLCLLPMFGSADCIEDRITGYVDDLEFTMHELRLVTNGKNKKVHFRGQIFVMDCRQKFMGKTLVLRDKGKISHAVTRKVSGLKRAGFADPVFEKTFEVYTTDQVEARYLLPPDFMQRILDLEAAAGGKNIRFAFSDAKLFIAVETGNSFEPGHYFKSFNDRGPAQKIIKELRAVHALIEGLGR